MLHFIADYTNSAGIGPEDRLTSLYSCSVFSGAVRDNLAALLNGATVLPFRIRQEGIASLARWLSREAITIYHSVPSVFRRLTAALTGPESFPALRIIWLGGEPVRRSDVDLYRRHFAADCVLVHGFSTTETGAIGTYVIDAATPIDAGAVPVGYPVDGTEVLLLDAAGGEVVPGAVGEIAVRSRHLALGYWRDPALTDARFRPDPGDGRRRLYLTGDLGRRLPDGRLIHLGRTDFRVKVRGHGVAPAEVESALLDLDGVREAVVVALADADGEPRLVAYWVAGPSPPPTASGLRRALAARLAEWMIPSVFVKVDALPLTAGGKVDRASLPPPPRSRPELDTPFAPPRGTLEETLAEIWSEVLGLDQVGIHDDFLELGGDSLRATLVLSRVSEVFRREVPLASFFERPTIAGLSGALAQARPSDAGSST